MGIRPGVIFASKAGDPLLERRHEAVEGVRSIEFVLESLHERAARFPFGDGESVRANSGAARVVLGAAENSRRARWPSWAPCRENDDCKAGRFCIAVRLGRSAWLLRR